MFELFSLSVLMKTRLWFVAVRPQVVTAQLVSGYE